LIGSAFNFDKTNIYYQRDENNLAIKNEPLNVFGVSQDFRFPNVYFAEKKRNQSKVDLQETKYSLQLLKIKRDIYSHYYELSYAKNKVQAYQYLDSLYTDFAIKAKRRFELGETNYLEMITARSKQKQLETLYKQSLLDVNQSRARLKKVVQVDSISIKDIELQKLELQNISLDTHEGLSFFAASIKYQQFETKLTKQSLLPDISAEYFQGTNSTLNQTIIGYQFGLKIPFLFGSQRSKIKAYKISEDIVAEQKIDFEKQLQAEYESLLAKLSQCEESIIYYEHRVKRFPKKL